MIYDIATDKKRGRGYMINERKMAKELLNAVWNKETKRIEELLDFGADPNWIFNGYPILLHAVYTRNVDAVLALMQAGACQQEEALGFALENGIGEVVVALATKGIVPRKKEVKPEFGAFPSRYSPLDYHPKVVRS